MEEDSKQDSRDLLESPGFLDLHRPLDPQELEDLRDLRLHPGYRIYLSLLHELADDWRNIAMSAKDWESYVAARKVWEVINYTIIPLIFGELEGLEVLKNNKKED